MEQFDTLKEAQVLIEAWRDEYNAFRPHSALGYQTPNQFADCWHATHPSNPLREVVQSQMLYFLMLPKLNPSQDIMENLEAALEQLRSIY